MSNLLYNQGLAELFAAATGIAAGDWQCLLESSTSTYVPDKDHTSLLDQPGFMEISVAS